MADRNGLTPEQRKRSLAALRRARIRERDRLDAERVASALDRAGESGLADIIRTPANPPTTNL